MRHKRQLGVRVVLLGLPAEIAESLGQIISEWGAVLDVPPLFPILQGFELIPEADADLVFVWTGANVGASILELVRKVHPQISVVAVNLDATNAEMLDALDSGAIDYCTSPFDLTHIHWLLQAANQARYCC
jgi:DNA-binding NtrC family response regulator